MLSHRQAYCGYFRDGWLLTPGSIDSNPSWHSDAVSGSDPPHVLEAVQSITTYLFEVDKSTILTTIFGKREGADTQAHAMPAENWQLQTGITVICV
jgi:hypothetical protein